MAQESWPVSHDLHLQCILRPGHHSALQKRREGSSMKGGLLRSDVTLEALWSLIQVTPLPRVCILGYISMHNFSVKVTTFLGHFFHPKPHKSWQNRFYHKTGQIATKQISRPQHIRAGRLANWVLCMKLHAVQQIKQCVECIILSLLKCDYFAFNMKFLHVTNIRYVAVALHCNCIGCYSTAKRFKCMCLTGSIFKMCFALCTMDCIALVAVPVVWCLIHSIFNMCVCVIVIVIVIVIVLVLVIVLVIVIDTLYL